MTLFAIIILGFVWFIGMLHFGDKYDNYEWNKNVKPFLFKENQKVKVNKESDFPMRDSVDKIGIIVNRINTARVNNPCSVEYYDYEINIEGVIKRFNHYELELIG